MEYKDITRTVDRTDRRHRSWTTSDGTHITDLTTAKAMGLKYHEATGFKKSTDPETKKEKKIEGKFQNEHHLTPTERKTLKCDSGTNDTPFVRDAWKWPVPKRFATKFGNGGVAPGQREAKQTTLSFATKTPPLNPWQEHRKGTREVTFAKQGQKPAAPPLAAMRWCQWKTGSELWLASTYHTGPCQPPSHPKVRMWNRYVAAFTTPIINSKRSNDSPNSINYGRRIANIVQRARQGVFSRPQECGAPPSPSANIIDYETTHVVYAIVPIRQGAKAYVGVTSSTAYKRHVQRLNDVNSAQSPIEHAKKQGGQARSELTPFETHLQEIGQRAALHDYYIVILEHVPKPDPKMTNATWARMHVKPYERFWVATLGTAFTNGGWNVEHSPPSLTFANGRPTRVKSPRQYPSPNKPPKRDNDMDVDMPNDNDMDTDASQPHHLPHVPPPAGEPPPSCPPSPGDDDESDHDTERRRRGRHAPRWVRRQRRAARGLQPLQRVTLDAHHRVDRALQELQISEAHLERFLKSLGPNALNAVCIKLSQMASSPCLTAVTTARNRARAVARLRHANRKVTKRRPLLISAFADACIERMQLSRLACDPDAMSSVPDQVWAALGRPLVAYKYSERPFFQIANASLCSREANDGTPCVCHLPHMAPYVDPKLGHVCTKDANILGHWSTKAAEIALKGTKHRTLPASLYHVDREKDEDIEDTVENRVMQMVEAAFEKMWKDEIEEKIDCPHGAYEEYVSKVMDGVRKFTESLTDAEVARLEKASGENEQFDAQDLGDLARAHQELHIGEADKESGTYTFCCRCHHDTWIKKETTGESSNYVAHSETPEEVKQRHYKFCEEHFYLPKLETNPSEPKEAKLTQAESFAKFRRLATLYATIKTHKEPMKPRFIAGGRNNTLELANTWLHRVLWMLKPEADAIFTETMRDIEAKELKGRFGRQLVESWIVNSSQDVVERVRAHNANNNHLRTGPAATAAERLRWSNLRGSRPTQSGVHDFSSLYTTFDHQVVRNCLERLLTRIFNKNRLPSGAEPLLVVRRSKSRDGDEDREEKKWQAGEMRPTTNVRSYSREQIVELLNFILDNAFVMVGGELLRQESGIPMGYGSSPMIANLVLALLEIEGIEGIIQDAKSPDGTVISTAQGDTPNTPETRIQQFELAGRLSRCARMIDDVLFIDVSPEEQRWALKRIYKPDATGLNTTEECVSPQRVMHLDMEILEDHLGLYTTLYDKRDALAEKGKMGEVRRFPNVDSVLADSCKYGTYKGYLHRVHRVVMRRSRFAALAAQRAVEMWRQGYNARKLKSTAGSFVRHGYRPSTRARAMRLRVNILIDAGIERASKARAAEQAAAAKRAAAAARAQQAAATATAAAQRAATIQAAHAAAHAIALAAEAAERAAAEARRQAHAKAMEAAWARAQGVSAGQGWAVARHQAAKAQMRRRVQQQRQCDMEAAWASAQGVAAGEGWEAARSAATAAQRSQRRQLAETAQATDVRGHADALLRSCAPLADLRHVINSRRRLRAPVRANPRPTEPSR